MGNERTTEEAGRTTGRAEGEEFLDESQQGVIGAGQAGQEDLARNLPNILNQLLTGGQLPGFLQQLTQGISPEAIGSQATRLAGQAGAGFQSLGIGDSGVAFRETARGIANELLLPAEQFNIGTIQNLLNLGLGQGTTAQNVFTQQQQVLGSRLAGLRPVQTTGTTTGMNPFLKAFQTSLGTTLGSPQFGLGQGGPSGVGFGGPSTVIG